MWARCGKPGRWPSLRSGALTKAPGCQFFSPFSSRLEAAFSRGKIVQDASRGLVSISRVGRPSAPIRELQDQKPRRKHPHYTSPAPASAPASAAPPPPPAFTAHHNPRRNPCGSVSSSGVPARAAPGRQPRGEAPKPGARRDSRLLPAPRRNRGNSRAREFRNRRKVAKAPRAARLKANEVAAADRPQKKRDAGRAPRWSTRENPTSSTSTRGKSGGLILISE